MSPYAPVLQQLFSLVDYLHLAFISYGRAFHPVDGNCLALHQRQRKRSLFALNAILPFAGILCENLKQVSILGNSWDSSPWSAGCQPRWQMTCHSSLTYFTGKRTSASVQLCAFSPREIYLIVE